MSSPALQTLKDPVCGMKVTDQSANVFNFKGKPIYFCSAGCKAKFAADPAKYLVADSSSMATVLETKSTPSEPTPTGTIYTYSGPQFSDSELRW